MSPPSRPRSLRAITLALHAGLAFALGGCSAMRAAASHDVPQGDTGLALHHPG